MAAARKFYRKFLPQLGFVHEKPGRYYHIFYSAGGDKPSEFFGLDRDKIINLTAHALRSGQIQVRKWTGSQSWCATPAGKRLKVPSSAPAIVPATTRFSSRTRTATSWRSAAGRVRLLPAKVRGGGVGCEHDNFAGDTPAATVAK